MVLLFFGFMEIPTVVKLLIKKLSDDLEEPQFKSVWVQPHNTANIP